uniref:SatD family protein n=1 Tax=Microbacterium sp. B19 TaxID=96765 RepID=UPI0003B46FE2
MTAAVIADIVRSRELNDRTAAQRAIERAVARAEVDVPLAVTPLTAVVGDELQAEYPTVAAAAAALLLVRLNLPDGVECRFGVGVGDVRPVELGDRTIPEGPAWWAARAAIERIEAVQQRVAPLARTWFEAHEGADAEVRQSVALANAYALSRDQLVSSMSERARRLTYGRCLGRSQRELAGDEGITQ